MDSSPPQSEGRGLKRGHIPRQPSPEAPEQAEGPPDMDGDTRDFSWTSLPTTGQVPQEEKGTKRARSKRRGLKVTVPQSFRGFASLTFAAAAEEEQGLHTDPNVRSSERVQAPGRAIAVWRDEQPEQFGLNAGWEDYGQWDIFSTEVFLIDPNGNDEIRAL